MRIDFKMAKQQVALLGMRLIFVSAIIAAPINLLFGDWLYFCVAALELIGSAMLLISIRSIKYKLSVACGAINLTLEIIFKCLGLYLFSNMIDGHPWCQLGVGVATTFWRFMHYFFLYRATADFMKSEGCIQEADSGYLAANMMVVWALILLTVLAISIWIETEGEFLSPVAAVSAVVGGLLGIAAIFITIILLIVRLTYFWRCGKRLIDGGNDKNR